MTPAFAAQLTDFRNYAWRLGADFGQQVDNIISSTVPAGMGLAPTDVSVQVNTVSKLTAFVDTVAKGYLDTLGAYYNTKAEIAKLKVKAQGGLEAAAGKTAGAASDSFAKHPLLWMAGGGLVLVLLMRR